MANQLNPRELRQQAAAKARDAQGIVEKAKAESRGLKEDERTQLDALQKEARGLIGDAERLEGNDQLQADLRLLVGPGGNRPDARIGMDGIDLRNYSLIRAIRAAADAPKNPHAWDAAQLELEASRAVAQRLGRNPQGFFVPVEVQMRDLTKGSTTGGGYTAGTDFRPQDFIEMLRNRMVVRQAGATILSGLQGDVAIPSQTGGATAYWVAESGAPTESQQAVGQIALLPKTVGAYTDISRKLLLQSSIDVERFVQTDLSTVLALAMDLAALHGTGTSNQPKGVAAQTGIGSVAGGDNGAAPTWANIVSLETEIAQDNADVNRLAYITNAKVRGKLKSTPITATYGEKMIWGEGATPLNGYAAWVSNQVSSALSKGTASGTCSAIFFGNWADLIIALWGGLDILVDPYTGSTSGTVRVVALQDADITVRHVESFAAMLDALTA